MFQRLIEFHVMKSGYEEEGIHLASFFERIYQSNVYFYSGLFHKHLCCPVITWECKYPTNEELWILNPKGHGDCLESAVDHLLTSFIQVAFLTLLLVTTISSQGHSASFFLCSSEQSFLICFSLRYLEELNAIL